MHGTEPFVTLPQRPLKQDNLSNLSLYADAFCGLDRAKPIAINILIVHSQSANVQLQMMSITWIREFVSLAGGRMLPFTSGILTAVLPCLAYDDEEHRTVREIAKTVNIAQMNLVKRETEVTDNDDKLDLPSVMEVYSWTLVGVLYYTLYILGPY